MPEHTNWIAHIWTVALLAAFFFVIALSDAGAQGTTITATVKIPICGDGIVESPEECDGSSLSGGSCTTRGFTGGSLSCTIACEFDTSLCTSTPISSGSSGGGGGGGGSSSNSPKTSAVFSGRAYPRSTVTLLKDAQIAATTIAGADAKFQITLSGLSGGNYIFSVYSEDKKGVRSSLLTFPTSVTAGATTNITGIFIAPTIATDKEEVRRGDNITIFGQAVPASEVTVSINSEEEFFVKRIADAAGTYLLNFDTSVLEMGQHHTKSKAALSGEITAFGKVAGFIVGTKNVAAEAAAPSPAKGDVNNDGRVNLVDFSITAYWYKRPNYPASSDLNSDGKIDLVDFSIMAFSWTG
jgi:hypothetical protein